MVQPLALVMTVLIAAVPPGEAPAASPEAVVQRQVEAYNAHDLDAFVACYGPEISFCTLDGKVNPEQGLAALRQGYKELFARFPRLRVTILRRIVQGRFVVDQERAEGMGAEPVTVTAIYETSGGKIIRVWFIEGS